MRLLAAAVAAAAGGLIGRRVCSPGKGGEVLLGELLRDREEREPVEPGGLGE
jgi:hypothetical protein